MSAEILQFPSPSESGRRGGRGRRAALAGALVAVLAVGGAVVSPSAASATGAPYPAAERYAPTPVPDRILLIPTEDPSTSQRVSWRAETGSPRAQIIAAPDAFGDVQRRVNPDAYEVVTVDAIETSEVDPRTGYVNRYHVAEFTGLQPGTRYSYRVGDSSTENTSGSGASSINNWSPWMDFTTAETESAPFSFIYHGDAQNYIDSAVARVWHQAVSDRPDARLTLHAGDLMNQTGTSDASLAIQEKEWAEWYAAAGTINQTRNIVASPGNHEYNSSTAISAFWKPQFPYPANGPRNSDGSVMAEVERSVYFVDYQGVRFISLDTSPLQNGPLQTHVRDAQVEWLELVLSDEDRPKWTVVTFHHPIFSGSGSRDNANARAAFVPLFEEYQVDLVLQGHDHVYNRGNLSTADDPADPARSYGTVYSVSVAGGKMYDVNQGQNWSNNGATRRAFGENVQLYQLIDVAENSLLYQARTATGEFFDGYRIQKPGDGWESAKVVTDLDSDPEAGEAPAEDADGLTITSLTASVDIVELGEPVELSATVVPSVAGSVEFRAGSAVIAGPVTLVDGVATVEISDLPEGIHSITAWFTAAEERVQDSNSTARTVQVRGEAPVEAPFGHSPLGTLESPTIETPGSAALDAVGGRLFVGDSSGAGVIQAIDVETDEILGEFALGPNGGIRDIEYVAPLEAVVVAFSGSRIGAFSVAPSSFGAPLIDPIVFPSATRGVAIDVATNLGFVTLSGGGLVVVDVASGSAVRSVPTPSGIYRAVIDPADGHLYVAFDDNANGSIGLRVYDTRSPDFDVIREVPLDRGVRSVALDADAELVYVGHRPTTSGQGGLSVISLEDGDVTRLSSTGFGGATQGVAADAERGLIYAVTSNSTPAPVAVSGRWLAPQITEHPVSHVVEDGASAEFSASAWGVPFPSVAWQLELFGDSGWSLIEGADEPTLTLTATPELHQARIRAAFSNEIDGVAYTNYSAPVTLQIEGLEIVDPGDGDAPGDDAPGGGGGDVPGDGNGPDDGDTPGDADGDGPEDEPGTPGTPSSTADGELVEASRGGISAPASAAPGDEIDVEVGTEHTGDTVRVWLHSTPTLLGSPTVASDGTVRVTLPESASIGSHRIVVQSEDGQLLGWTDIVISVASTSTPAESAAAPGRDLLGDTGSDVTFPVAGGALLLLTGVAAVILVRLRRSDATEHTAA